MVREGDCHKRSVERCEWFINDVLRADLGLLSDRLAALNTDLQDLQQEIATLDLLIAGGAAPTFDTQVPLGCDTWVRGRVRGAGEALVHVGLGVHLAASAAEARAVLEARAAVVRACAADVRARAAATRAHIKLMLLGLHQLRSAAPSAPHAFGDIICNPDNFK